MAEDNIPYRQLIILCVCRFAEPICFTVIFPFIVSMIRDFDICKEEDIGYYVGFITASFAFAQLLTGIHFGRLSDKIGRKPVILFGLIGSIISIFSFGLSKSYTWALLSRTLCGLLNGNVGVLRCMIGELTLDLSQKNRARCFSFLPLMYGLGSVIGPVLGGYLSNPVKQHPNVFGNLGFVTDFLVEFPYFLPCFVSATICACGWMFGYLYMEETLGGVKYQQEKKKREQLIKDEQRQPLLSSNHNSDGEESDEGYSTFSHNNNINKKPLPKREPPTLREALTPLVWSISIPYAIYAFQVVFYDELFPIWTASKRDFGGLGFVESEIGTALAYVGIVILVTQLFILPHLVQRFGVVRLLRFVLFTLIIVYMIQGFVRYLYDIPDLHGEVGTKFWVWAGLSVILAVKTMCQTTAFMCCTLIVNNSCERLDALGAVNGFAQCCCSFMRALGPATCGIIWSQTVVATWLPFSVRTQIIWQFLALVALITYLTSLRLDARKLDISQAKEEVVEINDESDTNSERTISQRC
ncbi:unnamed protein product [Cunninghamella blakesleeana]